MHNFRPNYHYTSVRILQNVYTTHGLRIVHAQALMMQCAKNTNGLASISARRKIVLDRIRSDADRM